MLITASDRLQHVRKHIIRKTQAELAELLGISDVAYGMREKGATRISADDADAIHDKYGVNQMWLLYGSGEMLDKTTRLSEPAPEYTLPNGCDKRLLRIRFIEVVNDYMAAHGIGDRRELCERWDLNETQLSNIMSEKTMRDVSLSMLMNALYYGNVNLNYVICGKGEKFLSSKTSAKWQSVR